MSDSFKPLDQSTIEHNGIPFSGLTGEFHLSQLYSPIKSQEFFSPACQKDIFLGRNQMLKSPQLNSLFQTPACLLTNNSFHEGNRIFEDCPLGLMFDEIKSSPKQESNDLDESSQNNHEVSIKPSKKRSQGFRIEQVNFSRAPIQTRGVTNAQRFQTPQTKIQTNLFNREQIIKNFNCYIQQKSYQSDVLKSEHNQNGRQIQPVNLSVKFAQEEEDYDQGNKQRGQKGRLRNMSLRVKDIVRVLKKTTYKEVAEKLIIQLQKPQERLELIGDQSVHSKDEQNIKRRVYDALNVMIASGVLKKDGKHVIYDEASLFNGKIFQNSKDKEIKELENQLQKYRVIIEQKKQNLTQAFYKCVAVDKLISRNQSMMDKEEHKLFIPFIVFQNFQQNIKIKLQGTKFVVNSKQDLNLISDFDILLHGNILKLDQKDYEKDSGFPQIEQYLKIQYKNQQSIKSELL